MNRPYLIRFATTLIVVVIALVLMHAIWERYMYSPWTRDGRVRANVINLSTDVSGIVKEVRVKDNEWVHKGDVLYVLDPERFVYALQQADADVAHAQAQLLQSESFSQASQYELKMRKDQAERREKLSADV